MDIATLIGFVAAVAMVMMAVVSGGDIGVVVNIPSMLIVVGGSAGVIMMKFSLGQFFGAVKVGLKVLLYKSEQPIQLIDELLELSQSARKEGLLALESAEVKNSFLKKGLQYLVDGLDPEVLETTLEKERNLAFERHMNGQSIFKSLGDVAPAMGMIGTLIGLVQMLSNMSDPSSIGPAMAVAMLTTLYGAMLANLVAIPIAEKLTMRAKEEMLLQSMMIDAILSIQAGQNPRIMKEILVTYLPSSKRASDDDGKEKAAA